MYIYVYFHMQEQLTLRIFKILHRELQHSEINHINISFKYQF